MWVMEVGGVQKPRRQMVVIDGFAWPWEDIVAKAEDGETDFGSFQLVEMPDPVPPLSKRQFYNLMADLGLDATAEALDKELRTKGRAAQNPALLKKANALRHSDTYHWEASLALLQDIANANPPLDNAPDLDVNDPAVAAMILAAWLTEAGEDGDG